MSEQKQFQRTINRNQNRLVYSQNKTESIESSVKTSFVRTQNNKSEPLSQQKVQISSVVIRSGDPVGPVLVPASRQNIRKLTLSTKNDIQAVLKDKALRQDIKKEYNRISKARTDSKSKQQNDIQLLLLSTNNILNIFDDHLKQQSQGQSTATKSSVRVNQEKDIQKQLATIDEQLKLNNIVTVKSTMQTLMKKYGKDELLNDKLSYLNYLAYLHDEYDRQASLAKQLTGYIQKLSSFDLTDGNSITQSVLNFKNLKKQLMTNLNKQNKKSQPNEKVIYSIGQVQKIDNFLLSTIEPKSTDKKETKPKRELELQKQILDKNKLLQVHEQGSRYCKDLLQKSAQKEELFKELDTLKKNKKKSSEAPYNLLLRLYEIYNGSRKEINDIGLYLKNSSQLYLRKNLNIQSLTVQLKKNQEKFGTNEALAILKPNIDTFISNIQQRQKWSNNSQSHQIQISKLRQQNQKLQMSIEQHKKARQLQFKNKPVQKQVQDILDIRDKKLQQGITPQKSSGSKSTNKDLEKTWMEKEDKAVSNNIDMILANIQEKKFKVAKNNIVSFKKKFEQSQNPTTLKYIQIAGILQNLMAQFQGMQINVQQKEKQERASHSLEEKQMNQYKEKIRDYQQYHSYIKNFVESYSKEPAAVKKMFDDLRRDKKKANQERYSFLLKLEEPFLKNRAKTEVSQINQTKNIINLSYSSVSNSQIQHERLTKEKDDLFRQLSSQRSRVAQLQSKLRNGGDSSSKQTQQLLNLVNRMQKGGQWWKFIPKTLNNSKFKTVYRILQKYRQNELQLQKYRVNQALYIEQGERASTINFAIDNIIKLLDGQEYFNNDQFWERSLMSYKGNIVCDKLLYCLRSISSKAKLRLQQSHRQVRQFESDLIKLQPVRERETSSKKSGDLSKSRRSVSRSKEKDNNQQIINQYAQQQKVLLKKMEQYEKEKAQSFIRITQIQQLFKERESETSSIISKYQNKVYQLQQAKMQYVSRINLLQGQLEILENRYKTTEQKLQSQISYYIETNKQLEQRVILISEEKYPGSMPEITINKVSSSVERLQQQARIDQLSDIIQGKENEILSLREQLNTIQDLHRLDIQNLKQTLQVKYKQDLIKVQQDSPKTNKVSSSQLQQKDKRIEQLSEIIELKQNQITSLRVQMMSFQDQQRIQIQNLNISLTEKYRHDLQVIEHKYKIEGLLMETTTSTVNIQAEKLKWQAQYSNRIHLSIQEYERNEIPKILELNHQHWNHEKQLQWSHRVQQIENYWISQLNNKQNQYKLKLSTINPVTVVNQHVHIEISQTDIMNQIRLQKNRHLIDNIIFSERQQWQLRKNQEIKQKLMENDLYWRDLVLPGKRQEWEKEYRLINTVQSVNTVDHSEIIEEWKRNNLEAIILRETSIVVGKMQEDWIINREPNAIQAWKQANLTLLVQTQQRKAVDYYIAHTLPTILSEQRAKWQQYSRSTVSSVQITTFSHEQIQSIIHQQRSMWELAKLEEIKHLQLQFQTRLNEKQRKLNEQLLQYQEKYIRQKAGVSQSIEFAIQRIKNNEFPLMIEKERQIWLIKQRQYEERRFRQKEEEFNMIIVGIQNKHNLQYREIQAHSKEYYDLWQKELMHVEGLVRQLDRLDAYYKEQIANLTIQINKSTHVQVKEVVVVDETKIKQVEKHWLQVILPQRQLEWKRRHDILITTRVQQLQKEFNLKIIPNMILQQKTRWQSSGSQVNRSKIIELEQMRRLKERQFQQTKADLNQQIGRLLDQINMLTQMNQQLQQQLLARHKQQLQALLLRHSSQIRQLTIRLESAEQRNSSFSLEMQKKYSLQISELNQIRNRLQIQLKDLRNQQNYYQQQISTLTRENECLKKQLSDLNDRFNQENGRKYNIQQSIEQYKRIISIQKDDLSKLSALSMENDRLNRQILSLKESYNNLDINSKKQMNSIRSNFQLKISESNNEKNQFFMKMGSLQKNNQSQYDKEKAETIQSYEKQMATLVATLKTKQNEILFLKKSAQNNNIQCLDLRRQLLQQSQKRRQLQNALSEVKNSRLELQYELKYLKDRQGSLNRKVQSKEQDLLALKRRYEGQIQGFQKKLRSTLELSSSYQIKLNELQSRLQARSRDFSQQNFSSKRYIQEISALKSQLQQGQGDRRKYEHMLRQKEDCICKMQLQLANIEMLYRKQLERIEVLTIQLEKRDEDFTEIEVLNKINKDVSNLTSINRQLETKCVLLENRQKITQVTSQIINYFLLVQKHTESLVDFLHQKSLINNLQVLHQFFNNSKILLSSGRIIEYFERWQQFMRNLFLMAEKQRSSSIDQQAKQLHRLKAEMNMVLSKHVEMNEKEQANGHDQYKLIVEDIRSLVQEYVRTKDENCLRILCNSLGIRLSAR